MRPPGSHEVAFTDVALLARHFGVSYEATTWRLRSLRIMTAGRTQQLLENKDAANRYLRAVRASPGARTTRDDLATRGRDPELEAQVLHLALEASRRDAISGGRLREIGRMLDIDEEDRILEFHAVDPSGTSTRYAERLDLDQLDLGNLREVMDGVSRWLQATCDWLAARRP